MNISHLRFCLLVIVTVLFSVASIAHSSATSPVTTHTVSEDARTLSDVAIFLYGDSEMYVKIAKWNKLSHPYLIRLGQKLTLKEPPRLTSEQGSAKLLEIWRKRFGADVDFSIAASLSSEEKISREEFLTALRDAEKEELARMTDEEVNAKEQLSQGEQLLDANKPKEALLHFRTSRELDKKQLIPWFYEIRCLRLMNREQEAREVSKAFLVEFPQMSILPMFKTMFPEKGKDKS